MKEIQDQVEHSDTNKTANSCCSRDMFIQPEYLPPLSALISAYYTFLASFLFIFAGAPLIEKTHKNSGLKSILTLITAAVVGVILNLTIYFAKAVLFKGGFTGEIQYRNLAWLTISIVAIYKFKVNFILWIGISCLFGLATYLVTLL